MKKNCFFALMLLVLCFFSACGYDEVFIEDASYAYAHFENDSVFSNEAADAPYFLTLNSCIFLGDGAKEESSIKVTILSVHLSDGDSLSIYPPLNPDISEPSTPLDWDSWDSLPGLTYNPTVLCLATLPSEMGGKAIKIAIEYAVRTITSNDVACFTATETRDCVLRKKNSVFNFTIVLSGIIFDISLDKYDG